MADPRPPKTPERTKSNKKVGNGLVAMSSAAVLTVYAAGYVRTRAAAERLEAATQRRPELPGPRDAGGAPSMEPQRGANPFATAAPQEQLPAEPSSAAASSAAPGAATAATSAASGQPAVASTASVAPGAAAAPASHADAPAAVTPTADAIDALTSSVPSAAATAPAPAAPVAVVAKVETPTAAALPAAPLPTAPVSNANAQSMERPPAAPAPAPAAPKGPAWAGPWKDGKYLGMGYSRHGDIQAQVVVENGRIVYAVIAKCLTRYSCSIIEHLQKQVSQRQSPEVDYVAAATESANAFYGAIVEALKSAK